MIILGITGLIASGKSFIAEIFASEGVAIFDADKVVHQLYEDNEIINAIKVIVPNAVSNNQLDRIKLSSYAFKSKNIITKLEQLIHPLVRKKLTEFLQQEKDKGTNIVLLDVPLLYEGGLNKICQYVIYCTAKEKLIEARYLARKNSTKEKLGFILAKQNKLSKVNLADFVINTGKDNKKLIFEVKKIIKVIKNA
jgi:dephospho-CoA kinase